MALFRLIRFPNLLIVVLTQYLLEYKVVLPLFRAKDFSPALDDFYFFLLVLSTVFIAAGGYIINDIEDLEIDKINKPDRQIIGNSLSLSQAWLFYISLFISGLAISFYLAWHIQNIPLVLIYPAAWALLWMYSKWLKKMPFIGNIVVGIFCAFVAGIIWFAERETFFNLDTDTLSGRIIQVLFTSIFSVYMLVAFFSTIYREIIKDMEDILGDKANECRTIPIVLGMKKSKIIAFLFGLFFFIISTFWIFFFSDTESYFALLFLILFLFCPLLYSFYLLYKATSKKDFYLLSQLAKWLMLVGILLLFFI